MANIKAVKHNERIKGWASLLENGALAFFVAAGAQGWNIKGIDDAVQWAVGLGFASIAVAWYIRSHLKAES